MPGFLQRFQSLQRIRILRADVAGVSNLYFRVMHHCAHAAARHGLEFGCRRGCQQFGARSAQCCLRQRVLGKLVHAGCKRQHCVGRPLRTGLRKHLHCCQAELAGGERAGFVDSDCANIGGFFYMCAALEEHATARCVCNCGKDGGRRANYQSARRGCHHDGNGAAKGCLKSYPTDEWRQHDKRCGCSNHNDSVALLKSIDQPLCRRLLALRLLHMTDEAR